MIDTNEKAPVAELTIKELTWLIPPKIRLSQELIKLYLETSEGRTKLFEVAAEQLRYLFVSTVPTSRDADHYLGVLSNLLLHCDGTEVFNRETVVSNILKLSTYVPHKDYVGTISL